MDKFLKAYPSKVEGVEPAIIEVTPELVEMWAYGFGHRRFASNDIVVIGKGVLEAEMEKKPIFVINLFLNAVREGGVLLVASEYAELGYYDFNKSKVDGFKEVSFKVEKPEEVLTKEDANQLKIKREEASSELSIPESGIVEIMEEPVVEEKETPKRNKKRTVHKEN